jgi:hypothetical protein
MLIVILLACASQSFSQTYGKIFTNEEADDMFGKVLHSSAIPTQLVQELLNQTNNYIMFRIDNNRVIVLDNKRNVLFPEGVLINSQDVFTVYGVQVLSELLNLGNSSEVKVEKRSEVLSISSGGFTMEVGALCPPFCTND